MDTNDPTSTRTFLVVVENDVNRGTEGVPTQADPAYPSPGSILLKSELDQMAVRHDAAQTQLTATRLAQFLDNLGRSSGMLDLGTTDLKANAFFSDVFMEASGTYPLASWNDSINEWTAYISNLNAPCGINLAYGQMNDIDGNPALDWNARELWTDGAPMVFWGYDPSSFTSYLDVFGEYRSYGASGYSGSFFDVDGNEVIVSGGIITSVGSWWPA